MTSNLHKKLQMKGINYLMNKQYWIRASEMPTPVGIIDVWGISNSDNLVTSGIEVKVSRNDYKSLSQRYKERMSDKIANYCYLLCPEGMIKEHESPNWGILWYIEKTDRLKLIKHPTRFEMTDRDKLYIMVSLFENRANRPDRLLDGANLMSNNGGFKS